MNGIIYVHDGVKISRWRRGAGRRNVCKKEVANKGTHAYVGEGIRFPHIGAYVLSK